MISHGVEISIAGGVEEMVHVSLSVLFSSSSFFLLCFDYAVIVSKYKKAHAA